MSISCSLSFLETEELKAVFIVFLASFVKDALLCAPSAHRPSSPKLSESKERGTGASAAEPSYPLFSLQWHHRLMEPLGRGTGAQPNPTHHLKSGKTQSSPLGCCLSVLSPEMVGVEVTWHHLGHSLDKDFLPLLKRPSFLSPEPAKFTAFFTDHKQSVRFLLINSCFVALRPVINSAS